MKGCEVILDFSTTWEVSTPVPCIVQGSAITQPMTYIHQAPSESSKRPGTLTRGGGGSKGGPLMPTSPEQQALVGQKPMGDMWPQERNPCSRVCTPHASESFMKNLVRRLPVARVDPDVTVTSAFPFPISPQSSPASEQLMIMIKADPSPSLLHPRTAASW